MRHSIKSLSGFVLAATDGEVGTVKTFYFEDDTWMIRYVVVETGNWLQARKVLISTEALLEADWHKRIFRVALTMDQIKNSPDIDTEKPVYRQQEIRLYKHYALGNYWQAGYIGGGMPLPTDGTTSWDDDEKSDNETNDDLHLRSSEQVLNYHLMAMDGTIGTVEDFLIDDNTRKMDLMVVDAGNWLTKKNVVISTSWISEIRWDISAVIVELTRDSVIHSPEYDQSQLMSSAYLASLRSSHERFSSL